MVLYDEMSLDDNELSIFGYYVVDFVFLFLEYELVVEEL